MQVSPPSEPAAVSPDYSQPEAVADLFYQLILARRWDDAYSLLTRESKDSSKLGDFIQYWSADESRTRLIRVERTGPAVIEDQEAHLYYESSYDQAYPKPGSFKMYTVRSLLKEDGAWRLRWRTPQRQTDLGRTLILNQSQVSDEIAMTLEQVILLERATLIFFILSNRSDQDAQFDLDSAKLLLTDGRSVPLETTTERQLGPRKLESGQERREAVFFRALEPSVLEVVFVSPEVTQGGRTHQCRFPFQLH